MKKINKIFSVMAFGLSLTLVGCMDYFKPTQTPTVKPTPVKPTPKPTVPTVDPSASPTVSPSDQMSTPTKPVTEDEDGKTIINYNYSDYKKRSAYYLDFAPSVGTTKLLVVPVWFTDSSNYITRKDNVRNDIQSAYFGDESSTGWHSVSSYYKEESKGAINLTGVVTDWYECGKKSSVFASSGNGAVNTTELVKEVVNWYFAQPGAEDRQSFDADHNGLLDGVLLIYGAPDSQAYPQSGDADNLWAYCYWLQDPLLANSYSPGPNAFFWASYDFMYSSATAYSRTGKSNYASGDTTYATLDAHTFIHEMGHVFGLEDYYDYSGAYSPAAGFSMQDMNIGGHEPFSTMALGWTNPIIPKESCTIAINDFQSSHDVILLTPSWNQYSSVFDEYFLLELYTPDGLNKFDSLHSWSGHYPKGSSKPGIRLWHVDARLLRYKQYVSGNYVLDPNPTVDILQSELVMFASNTYYFEVSGQVAGSCSELVQSNPQYKYTADFNILQIIKNSKTANFKPRSDSYFSSSDLFLEGHSFDMSTFSKQFVNSGLLNSKKSLGWSFTVESVSYEKATIKLIKE